MSEGSIQSVHFIGICGTAMASTAAALKEKGYEVTGSDQGVYPPMSTFLESKEIPIAEGYDPEHLAHKPDLVVIGNAISRGNPEAEYVLDEKLRYTSLPELLKNHFIQGKHSVVVAGTHGKTTTTSLTAWILEHAGKEPSFLIGGMPANLGQGARFTDSPYFVIEGDEYDTAFFDKRSKFVHYLPEVAIINNLEFDHADIFADLDAIQTSFKRFINLVPRNGLLLVNGDDPNIAPLLNVDHCPIRRVGTGPGNDVRILNFQPEGTGCSFELDGVTWKLPMSGEFNVRNAAMAILVAAHHGIEATVIQEALHQFRGIKRRMEVYGERSGVLVLDDFAHHPTAIAGTLKALRERYPRRRVWAIFEPRSNTTRRNVFQDQLAHALSLADVAVVAQVARLHLLQPGERLDPELLMKTIRDSGTIAHYLEDADTIAGCVARDAREGDVVCVLSNGGFGGVHQKILDLLS